MRPVSRRVEAWPIAAAGLASGLYPAVVLPLLVLLFLVWPRKSALELDVSLRRLAFDSWPMVFGTVLMILPSLATGGLGRTGLAPVLVPALVLVAAAASRRAATHAYAVHEAAFFTGVMSAAVLLTVGALAPIEGAVPRLLVPHENLLAAHIVVLYAILVSRERRPLVRHALVVGAAIACFATGSRSALIGVVVVAAVEFLSVLRLPSTGTRRRHALTWLGAVVAVSLVGLGYAPWRAHIVSTFAVLSPTSSTRNLVPASEDVGRPPWHLDGVVVRRGEALNDGSRVAEIVKMNESPSARAQVPVRLEPNVWHSLSFSVRGPPHALPGIHGWLPATASGGSEAVLRIRQSPIGEPEAIVSAPIRHRQLSWTRGPHGWLEVRLEFRVPGAGVRTLWIGPAPDMRSGVLGTETEFARFMISSSDSGATSYVPTYAESESVRTARSRIEIFVIAVKGIRRAPVVGRGIGTFASDQRGADSDGFAFAHAHNLLLQTAYERGLIGLTGLVFVVFGLFMWSFRSAYGGAYIVLIAILAMNLFDLSFWYGNVIVPTSVFVGWTARRSDDDGC